MNIDFHVHGILSKSMEFNPQLLKKEIEYGRESGLDGFILCEHFNAIYFKDIHRYLKENYKYEGDRYNIEGFSIFPGIEVSVKEKGHIVLVGNRDVILEIRALLQDNIEKENLVELKKLLNIADDYGCLKIGAHPCRKGHKLCNQPKEILSRLDAIDLNAKDIFKKGEYAAKLELRELSSRIGVNIVSGTDSHYPIQIGSIITHLQEDCSTISELRASILKNEHHIEISSTLDLRVFSAKIAKRYIVKNKETKLFFI